MINASSWTVQYLFVAFVALFAGPILSKLPAAQSFPVTLFGLSGPQTIRLIVEESGLVILCILSIRAFRQMPDNGRGFSFLRQLVLPMTTLFMVIVTDKTLRVVGLSLIDRFGPARYMIAYIAALTLTGLWITTAWLLNLNALQRLFRSPYHRLVAKSLLRRSMIQRTSIRKKNATTPRPRTTSPPHRAVNLLCSVDTRY
jgi:hypothetical protein